MSEQTTDAEDVSIFYMSKSCNIIGLRIRQVLDGSQLSEEILDGLVSLERGISGRV